MSLTDISHCCKRRVPLMMPHTWGPGGCEHLYWGIPHDPLPPLQLLLPTSSRPLPAPTTMRLPCNSRLQMEPPALGAQAKDGQLFSEGKPASSSGAGGTPGPGRGGA